MDKFGLSHQQELMKCHKELTDSFAMFAAGQYQAPFEQTVHKLIMLQQQHEKKKKKWKTFYYLQKELLKHKSKHPKKVSLFGPPEDQHIENIYGTKKQLGAAPPEEYQHQQKSSGDWEGEDMDEEIDLIIDAAPKCQTYIPESAAPGP